MLLYYLKEFIGFILIMMLILPTSGCSHDETEVRSEYVKFQDKMSMDWDSEQEMILIHNSIIQSRGSEDKYVYAYNILVSLNRMLSEDYPNTIEEVCEINTILNDDIYYDLAIEGMMLVKYDRWDETHNSTDYIEVFTGDEYYEGSNQ